KEGTTPTDATAEVVTGPQLEEIRKEIKAKYGFMCHLTKFFAKVGGVLKRKQIPYGDRGVVITPN
ncbi:MAG TPA: hypothetical protein VIK05_10070, partial [Ilumatobacteraceae bacterium]